MSLRPNYFYTWRCAKCFYHFANIAKVEGIIEEEKKCPKCKALNILTLTNKEIMLDCKLDQDNAAGYQNGLNGASTNYEEEGY